MNTKNNKRRQATRKIIRDVFLEMLNDRELREISVSDICKAADINRTTFYANYRDIYDLAERLKEELESEVDALFQNEAKNRYGIVDLRKLFYHISENPSIYRMYFKLGYDATFPVDFYDEEQAKRDFDERFMAYHIEFFRSGFNAVLRKWLDGGCKESPEEMYEIIRAEYGGRV